MKTLHRIFNNKLLKKYAVVFFLTMTFLILGKLTEKFKGDSSFMSLVNSFCFIVAGVAPLSTFFLNNNFPHNVKFLINQHFNRAELLIYFFFSQSLKVFLVVWNYLALGLVLFFYSDIVLEKIKLPSFNLLFSDYFIFFIVFLSAVYVFYFFALFGANKQDLQKVKAAKSTMKRNKKRIYAIAILSLILFHIFINYTIPHAIKGYLYSLFIAFTSLIVLNRTFKLTHRKGAYSLAGAGSLMICLPLMGIIYGMKLEIQDPDVDFKSRGDGVVYLDWMAPDFSEKEMLGLLKKSDRSNYKSLLRLFGDKVSFEASLSFVDTEYRAKKFIDFHSKAYDEDKVKKIVSHMSKLMQDKNLDFRFAQYSHSFFKHQKVTTPYIYELINSKSPYKQLASIYFAKNTFKKDKLLSFYKLNFKILDRSVANDRYVRRSIASEKKVND